MKPVHLRFRFWSQFRQMVFIQTPWEWGVWQNAVSHWSINSHQLAQSFQQLESISTSGYQCQRLKVPVFCFANSMLRLMLYHACTSGTFVVYSSHYMLNTTAPCAIDIPANLAFLRAKYSIINAVLFLCQREA